MDIKKTLLWVVFSVSGVMLLNNWQIAHGNNPLPFLVPTAASPVVEKKNEITTNSKENLPTVSSRTDAPTNSPISTPVGSSAKKIRLQNDLIEIEVSTKGGSIVHASLKKHLDNNEPVVLFNDEDLKTYIARTGLISSAMELPNHNDVFAVDGQSSDQFLKLHSEKNGVLVERTYKLSPNSYVLEVVNTIVNKSSTMVEPVIYNELLRNNKVQKESQFYSTFTGPAIYTNEHKYKEVSFEDIAKNKIQLPGQISKNDPAWISMVQHYFASAWIPSDALSREMYVDKLDNDVYRVGIKSNLETLKTGASSQHKSELFMGPEEDSVLNGVAPGFELIKDYGHLTIIAKPIFWCLKQIYSVIQNWGWSIVVLTIFIKLLFFPLSASSYKSMARMKEVQPRLMQMKEQFKNEPQKLNAAMMEMYKKEKINPLGGCLPVVIQIPVFISLYWVLLLSVEMRGAPWLGWIHDLSKPDTFFSNLLGIPWPVGILPIIMAASMFIQTRLNPTPPDPVQAKVMMFMPLAFSVMFFFFPSGLVLYYIVNNVLSIAQQWQINKMFGAKAVK